MRPDSKLERRIGLASATSINMMNMIGVGPFITLPLVVAAMGGPQAMLGWLLGAFIAVCDGLVWAELGAAMPEAGGSYAFLREIYGRQQWGRYLSFIYVWMLGFSVPLSVASGSIGLAQYAAYLWPRLAHGLPLHGLAAAVCALVVVLLYRDVRQVTALAWVLFGGVLLTLGAVLAAGLSHFHPQLLAMPAGALHPSAAFFEGLGAATLIATYDYWGYYNVCFLGEEIEEPRRNIPRAVLVSIAVIAVLYLAMNVSVLAVLPWRELTQPGVNRYAAVAVLLERTFGAWPARVIALLVMWTAAASVFTLLLGYSRAPFAAARDGNYFSIFARLHPRRFPHVSLLVLGGTAMVFCFFDLQQVIAALVAIRLLLQYLPQQVGVIVLRQKHPEASAGFRMWLYPMPPLLAMAGFLFILLSRHGAGREILYGGLVLLSGTVLFLARSHRRREWPYAK